MAVALTAAWLVWRRSKQTTQGGLFIGIDNRVSTSKTTAVAWTVVVAWMVASEALVAALPQHPPNTFSGLLSPASDLYFVFLGGPFAAAAFAKASVQSKITQGTLTKTTADTPSPSDLISDDYGNIDVYDFQYVLFNILALLIVIISFGVHPENGLPDIPAFLAILTGGSALTYTVNKAIAAGGAQITNVAPPKARIGDSITITGVQLVSTTAGAALPTVTVGGISATGVTIQAGPTDTLTATVADAQPGTMPLTGAVDVVVSPPQASPITSVRAITIVADQPAVTRPSQPITGPGLITVTGTLLLTPGTPSGTADPGTSTIGGLTPALTVSGNAWPVSIEGPYSDDKLTLRVGNPPAALGPSATGDATLTLTRGALQCSTPVRYEIPGITSVTPTSARIGDVITVTGVQLVPTTAGAALPTVTVGGISATGVTIPAGRTDTLTATVADAQPGTMPLTGAVDVVVSPPQASPITSRNVLTIVADQPAITQVQPQPITGPGLITVTGTLLLTPGTLPGTASPDTSSIGGLTPELTVSGGPWPVSIEGPYSDSELTLRVGTQPAALSPGATGDATLTLTRGALQRTTQVMYELP